MRIERLKTPEALEAHLTAWEDLSREASIANPFYEHWMLIPAMKHLVSGGEAPEVVLVYDGDRLDGLFPLVVRRRFRRVPLKNTATWKHLHCFLSEPLVRRGAEASVGQAFVEWFGKSGSSRLLGIEGACGDGPFYKALRDSMGPKSRIAVVENPVERAFLFREGTLDEHLTTRLGSKHRREFGRKERMLQGMGKLEYVVDGHKRDFDKWFDTFIALEGSGWKGQEGTALKCCQKSMAFVKDVFASASRNGRLFSFAAELDGRPIAEVAGLRSPDLRGVFLFKLAYDEAMGKASPGYLMELELLKRVMDGHLFDWVDSCAEPDSSISNRVWGSHPRKITYSAAAFRSFPERFTLSTVLPLVKKMRKAKV